MMRNLNLSINDYTQYILVQLENRCKKVPIGLLFLYFTIFKLAFTFLLGTLVAFVDKSAFDNPISTQDPFVVLCKTVLVAPLIETLIFLVLVYELGKRLRLNDGAFLLLSSFLFAISHSYSFLYIIATLTSGLIYGILYLYLRKRYDAFRAVLFVSGIHAINNLIGWLYIVL